MTKSMREAKVNSTWASPNTCVRGRRTGVCGCRAQSEESRRFCAAFLPFQARIARLGVSNSLVQTTLKLTAPGVPDIYQGAELWDLSLMDPDNRRPVDFRQRIRLLDELDERRPIGCQPSILSLLDHWQDGAVKLFLTSRILALRAAEPDLFEMGEYEPLLATGPKADCICAFVRRYKDRIALVVVARFPYRLEADPGWTGTSIPVPPHLAGKRLRSVLTYAELLLEGELVEIETVLRALPVAVFAAV